MGENVTSVELSEEDRAKLEELDAELAKFEEQRRWSDVIKTLLAKADIVVDASEKAELFRQAGTLYIDRSSNQAEAIKCFERLLEIEPADIEAIQQLKNMYEKRRDWASLIDVMGREAELLDPADRALRYAEMAELATQRLRKPEICIDLWNRVLSSEPGHAEALAQLAQLYERSQRWQDLTGVLEQLVDATVDSNELKKQLQKLGQIYGDKVGDDEGAVRAFRRLLELEPNDRRAQDQLKRRYTALRAWDDLEDFYAQLDKWDELIRVFEQAANKEEENEGKLALLFRVATLWQDRLGRNDRAARAYEKILGVDPDNLLAAEALSPIYEQANDPKKLAGVYEVRLKHGDDPDARVALLRETGLLYEERLRAASRAFELYLEAFELQPDQEVVREDVQRVAEAVKGWDRLVEVYEKVVQNAVGADAVALHLGFGDILATIERTDDAIAQYRAVYDAEDDNREAIEKLSALYEQTQQYKELLEMYDRQIDLEQDPDTRWTLAYARAALLEHRIQDLDGAIDAFRGILEEYGDEQPDAYEALDRLFEARERWQDLADTLSRRIDLGPESDEAWAGLKYRLGWLMGTHLDDRHRAVELYQEVLTIQPEEPQARAALEGLLDDAEVGASAAAILEPIYEVREEWENLIRALKVLREASSDPDERLALQTKIGEIYGAQLGDRSAYFRATCQALREAPDSEATVRQLEMLAEQMSVFDQLAALLQELAGSVDDPSLSRSLWIRAAQIHSIQLEDIDGSVSAYEKVLEGDPGDLEVLGALEELFHGAERWHDLVGVLRRRVEQTTDSEEQEELLAHMATIHDEQLNEPTEAIRLYREVLDIDPSSQRALAALDGLFVKKEMWADLADNVDRQLSMSTDPEQQILLMLQLAQLRETRMNAVEVAIQIYRDVLERDPQNEPALVALERLIEDEEHQLLIAEILEPLYRDMSAFEALIGVHEIQAGHAESPDRRVELLHQIADLYEVALDNPDESFNSYARALAEDPANPISQEHLERLAKVIENGSEALAGVYEERVATLDDPPLAAMLFMRAAQIRELELGDHEKAIAHYRKVLELDEQHLDAVSSLERLFQMAERYEELAGVYLTKSGMLPSLDEQKEYMYHAASIYEDVLERPLDAIQIYDNVLELDPEDAHSLDKLIELYLRLESWEQLLQVYTRKADIVADYDEKRRLYVEVGAVYERELRDIPKAIDTYQRILEIDPEDLVAIGRLDALYQATENWQELLSVLEREADLAGDPNEVISYRYRIAQLWRQKLEEPARAVDIYREILEVIPDHDPTLAALEEMIATEVEALAASVVLEPVYRASGDAANLIRMHEVQIAYENEDPVRQVELLHQVGELYEFQLDRAADAFQAFARALPLEPANDQTLSSIERIADDLGAWAEVGSLYDTAIKQIVETDPAEAVDLALRAARIYEVQLGDAATAIERYRIVYQADAGHVEAIESLDRLYEATERWQELAEILSAEIAIAATPDEILDLQYRLGRLYEGVLGNVDTAIEQYREILAAAPEHANALGALEQLFIDGIRPLEIGEIIEPLYRMQEQWHRLLDVHEIQLRYQGDSVERVSMMHRIAEIAEERAGDFQRAFEWQQRAVLEDPSHDHSLAEVERLGEMLDGWEQLANTYADALGDGLGVETKVSIGKRLARVYEDEMGDAERAEGTYRYVLALDQADEDTLRALDRIYSEHGAYASLAEVLERRAKSSDLPDDQVELNYRLGRVLDSRLGRTDDAIAVYQKVINDVDPHHMETIHALGQVYIRRQDWPNLYATFEKEVAVVMGDTQQAEVYARMARLAYDYLGDAEAAIDLWKKVLDLQGEDLEALNALGDIYAAQQNWRDLVDILEREVNVVEDDVWRAQIYADLGRLWYAKLERERNALENWERVLDIDPANVEALKNIAEIYRAGNQTMELVETLQRLVESAAAVMEAPDLEHVYIQLGYLFDSALEQPMDAVEAYNRALDVNPADTQVMDALEHIHRREGEWERVVDVLERRVVAAETAPEKVGHLLTVAAVWADKVEQRDRGTSAYKRILELDSLHEAAFVQLEDLHAKAERWDDLVDMYINRAEVVEETTRRVDLLRRMARVYEKHLKDEGQAYEALKIAWMEDIFDKETAHQLSRIAGMTTSWNDLLTTANELLAETTDPKGRTALCLHCARWYGEDLDRPDYAIQYYQQILTQDPANADAMQQMADLYRKMQDWQSLAQTLGSLVEMAQSPVIKASTYVQMGDLATEHLGLPAQAPSYYQKAIDAYPESLPALRALERVYRASEQWEPLLEMLQRQVKVLEDVDEVLSTRLKVAAVLEDRLSRFRDAIEEYRRIIEVDPVDPDALKGLERLYAHTEDWQALLKVLETELEIAGTEKERILLLIRIAAMWEEEFLKLENAAARLEQAVEIDPVHEGALGGLARVYRQMQRWPELVHTYERHVSATPDRQEKVRLYKGIGDVFAKEIGDPERAIDAYLNVLSIDENDIETLDALSRLYEGQGDYSSTLDMMGQLARLLDIPERQVELKYRMGRILDEQLGDRMGALDQYQTATDIDPGHLPSLKAMREIQLDGGDYLSAAKILEQEAQHTSAARPKAELLVQLGQLYQERLDEPEQAIECFEKAYENDGDNEAAALPLVAEYMEQARYAEAFPLLNMLFIRMDKRDAETQHRLSFQLGRAAMELGDPEEAVRALSRAYQISSSDLPTLMALAAAHFANKDWEKAFKFYQMLLVHHRDSLSRDELTDLYYRQGVIKREQNERRKAINSFDKALEEDPHHRATLDALVDLYTASADWENVVQFKRQTIEVANDDDERYALLNEVGDIWQEKIKNTDKAIDAYDEAALIKPEDHVVQHKLLGCYQSTKQWERAIAVIQHIADLSDRPSVKAKYLYTIAVIMRDEMEELDDAIVKFNEALDVDPDQLKAFEAINKILTQRKDWKNLERAYRKMIHRVIGKGNAELEFNLWHSLGIIYRDRQKNFEASAEAFRMASNLRPDDATQHQILAEVFSHLPERINDAIEEHQWLLRRDPYRVDSYRALYRLYFDARAYDKAWCLASTLSFLGKADKEQKEFYAQYKQTDLIRPKTRVERAAWFADLFHPDEDRYVAKIMEILAPAVHAAKAASDKALGLQKLKMVDIANADIPFVQTFAHAQQILGVPIQPRLFLQQQAPGGLAHVVGSNPPAVICGSTLLSGYTATDLSFVNARFLTYYMPEHFIRTLIASHSELRLVLLAGMRIGGVGGADPQVDALAQQLMQRLNVASQDGLRQVCRRFVEAGARTDIKQWMQTVELTALRAGLLICNDLETAKNMIQALPPEGSVDLPPAEKVKEVVLFSVSEQYFKLREALGIQIRV